MSELSYIQSAPKKEGYLPLNNRLVSPGGKYLLVTQHDGHAVLYPTAGGPGEAITGPTNEPNQEYTLVLQEDGNVVVRRGLPGALKELVWHANCGGEIRTYFLHVQDDANVVVYKGTEPFIPNDGAVWSSKYGKVNKYWKATAEWDQVGKYRGVGATKGQALEAARQQCMMAQPLDTYKYYCLNSPVRVDYTETDH